MKIRSATSDGMKHLSDALEGAKEKGKMEQRVVRKLEAFMLRERKAPKRKGGGR